MIQIETEEYPKIFGGNCRNRFEKKKSSQLTEIIVCALVRNSGYERPEILNNVVPK